MPRRKRQEGLQQSIVIILLSVQTALGNSKSYGYFGIKKIPTESAIFAGGEDFCMRDGSMDTADLSVKL